MTYPLQSDAGIPAAYLQPQTWVPDSAYQGGGYWAHYGGKGSHFTEPQLERLFIDAGGPSLDAPVMAAIAEQIESAGWSDAWNESGATGLWQVEYPSSAPAGMSREELFTPQGNARAAAALDRSSGFAPWGNDAMQVHVPPLAPSKTLPKGSGGAALPGGGSGGGSPGLLGNLGWNPLNWPGQIAKNATSGITGTLTEIAVLAPILLAAAAIAVLGLYRMTQPARQRIEERVDERAGEAAKIAAAAV